MTIERQAFFDVMASFPSGVAIVTTLDADDTPHGLTTTAVCSVSADPPTILVSFDRASRTLAALRASGRFVVNFAGEGGSELCLLFSSKEEDKFRDVRWRPTDKGLPLLHEAVLAWAECSTERELEIRMTSCSSPSQRDGGVQPQLEPPLMYSRRSSGISTPTHDIAEPDAVSIPAIEVRGRDLRWQGAEI